MPKPLLPYQGDQSFIFISYSHADNSPVLDEIAWLQSQGVRIWYDVGISTGSRWSDELAKHLLAAESLVFFATPRSAESENCLDEINFALDNNKKIVAVHLEQTCLPPGAALRLSHRQAIHRYELDDSTYRERLLSAVKGGDQATPPSNAARVASRHLIGLWVCIAAVLLLITAAGVFWFSSDEPEPVSTDAESEPPAEHTTAVSPALPADRIAVLPFDNLSPDPDDAYFAAGIHDEILNQLAQIPELSVIARSSVLQYATDPKPATQVAKELGVGSVIEGSVRYAGNRVRISAQLINGTTGAQLWSNVFDQQLIDVFEVQQAIGFQVADALKLKFAIADRTTVAGPPTSDSLAYSHYLRAVALWGNFQNIRQVSDALDAALARDPEFAQAWAFKAMIRNFEGGFIEFQSDPLDFTPELRLTALRDSREAARRALELDPNQAYAHMTLGVNKLFNELDLDASEFHHGEALRLRPQDYFILSSVGAFKISSGRVEEGLALMRRSLANNPADGAAVWFYARHLDGLHMYDEAVERAEHVTALLPDVAFGYVNLALIAARAGRQAIAKDAIEKALARKPSFVEMADIAWAYSYLGDKSAAASIVGELRRDHSDFPVPAFHLQLHIILGEHQQALDLIEQYLDDPLEGGIVRANLYQDVTERWTEDLRNLPRYRALVKRVQEEVNSARGH